MFKRLVILKVEFVIMYVIIIKIYLISYVYMKFHLCWHNSWHNWFSCSLSEEKKLNKVIHVALHSCKKGHCLTCSLTCSPRRPVSRWTPQCPPPPPPHTPPPRVSPSHVSALPWSPLPKSMDIQVSDVNKVCTLPVLLLWLNPARLIINKWNMYI